MQLIILQAIRKLVNGIVGDPSLIEKPHETRLRAVAYEIQQLLIKHSIDEV